MNAFSKPQNFHPDLMTVRHGRKGQATEYVEYKPYNTSIRFVAQKSGDWFFVFRIEPGKNGAVQTMGCFPKANSAAHQAHDMAMNEALAA